MFWNLYMHRVSILNIDIYWHIKKIDHSTPAHERDCVNCEENNNSLPSNVIRAFRRHSDFPLSSLEIFRILRYFIHVLDIGYS